MSGHDEKRVGLRVAANPAQRPDSHGGLVSEDENRPRVGSRYIYGDCEFELIDRDDDERVWIADDGTSVTEGFLRVACVLLGERKARR
jgi:hypothetical protein